MLKKELALRPLNNADIALLTSWLNKDYILKWYHATEDWLTEINQRHSVYSWIHHFIVMDCKTPIGFCQYYDCFHAKDLEDWYHVIAPDDTFSIDYLIGNEGYLGKGYGKEIVRLLSHTIQTIEKATKVIVQPEKENFASNHVLTANGYIYDEKQNFYYKDLK